MVDTRARRARLLFLLSNDYGELATAMYLLMESEFRPVLLMPDRLFAVNGESLLVPAYRYTSLREVTETIEREQPDIVFLFSGYLYAVNNIFDIETTETLVRDLRKRHRRIVTSDPFLGIMSEISAHTFSDWHPRKQWLTEHFSRLYRVLADVTHLYLINAEAFAHTRSVSFFNRSIIRPPSTFTDCERKLSGRISLAPGRKRWVCVLSQEDYGARVARHGRARFDDMLTNTLLQTARAGRQPILVAPEACIASIQGRGPSIDGLVLLPFCDYGLFEALLLEAEYVFYWNIFSSSILARAINHLPVFFFDPGHMVHAIPPLHELGVKRYYPGAALTYLDQRRGLNAVELAILAAEQEDTLRDARENFERSPTPEEMVEKLLGR